MKYGTKADLDTFLEKYSTDTDRLNRVQSQLEWATADRWFIREVTDGPVETAIIDKLKNSINFPYMSDIVQNPINDQNKVRRRTVPVPVLVNPTINKKTTIKETTVTLG